MNRLRLALSRAFLPSGFRPQLSVAMAVFVSLVVFLSLGTTVWFQQTFIWDVPIILALHSLSHPWLDAVMWVISDSADNAGVVLALALAVGLWVKRERLLALTVTASFGGAATVNALLKLVFARPRPMVFVPLVMETDYSFPSGHVAAAMAFYGLLALLLWRRRRWGWAVVCALWVVAVGVSRIYLGVHYPSDVLGSLTFGLLWLAAIASLHDWLLQRWPQGSNHDTALLP